MASLKDKVVFITGASSGIGEASAVAFAKKGANLLLAARRLAKLRKLGLELKSKYGVDCKLLELDVRKKNDVTKATSSLTGKWKQVDILVNNAGLSRGLHKLHEGNIQDWEEMIDTNVKGLLYISRAVIPQMAARNKGHIINIGSIAGHEVYPKGNVYCSTKHAVDALTKGMRLDLVDTKVRVTTIDPGLVETEFSIVRFRGDEKKAKAVYTGIEPLTAHDVADAVVYAAMRPENVVVAEMILLANNQGSSAVVHRK